MMKAPPFLKYLKNVARRIEISQELAPLPKNRSKYVVLLLVATLLFLSGVPYIISERSLRITEEEQKIFLPFDRSVDRMERSVLDLETDLQNYFATGKKQILLSMTIHRNTFESELNRAKILAPLSGSSAVQALANLTEQGKKWNSQNALLQQGKPLLDPVKLSIEDVRSQIARQREVSQSDLSHFTRIILLSTFLLGLFALLGCGYLFGLARSVGLLYETAFAAYQQATSKSAQLEARLGFTQALIRNTPLGICVVELKTSAIAFGNFSFERLPFLKSLESKDRPIDEVFIAGSASENFITAIHRGVESKAVQTASNVEFCHADQGYSTFWNLRVIPFGEVANASDHLLLLWQDVTHETNALRQAEQGREQALKSILELQVVLDNMEDGVIVTNTQNEALVMNPHARELMGAALELRLPQPISILGQDISQHLEMSGWNEAPHTPTARVSFASASGGRLVELVANPVRNENGKVVSVVGVLHDITQSKKSEKEKDEFLALASHELKTPLTVLIASGQMASGFLRKKDYSRLEVCIGTVTSQLARLRVLVQQLFDYANLLSGRLKLNLSRCDLQSFVSRIVEEGQVLFSDRELEFSLSSAPVMALFDEVRIEEVMNNLISNAIRYSKKDTKIKIAIAQFGSNVRVCVTDHGIGIITDDLLRIFNRFSRGSNVGNVAGVGIGLYLSSEIIRAHGGRIWAESSGQNQGSAFYFELPLAS